MRLGAFVRPWNAKPDSKKHLAPGIPQATLWAHDRRGIGQVGCVYTAQGFEFDYVGVIFGQDLRYESARGGWVGHPEHSYDSSVVRSKGGFTSLVKRAYRVLLSRGHKGCYVHFTDKETEHFFRSRLDTEVRRGSGSPGRPISIPTLAVEDEELTPFRVLPFNKVRPFENAVPLLDLEAAAGAFGPDRSLVVDIEDVSSWVELAQEFRPRPGLFVTRRWRINEQTNPERRLVLVPGQPERYQARQDRAGRVAGCSGPGNRTLRSQGVSKRPSTERGRVLEP